MSNVLRNIPSVNELLDSPPLKSLVQRVNHSTVVSGVRQFLDKLRNEAQTRATAMGIPTPNELAERIAAWIATEERPPLRPVVNATGILLHTGLGRAPLPEEALDAVREVSLGYASVEVDLASGERSQRVLAVERLLTRLTGAEAAAVTNNNAGATLITLAALAGGKEVIVSRGQLIEIGGSYRLPEVMSASGAILREVGTTNKTRGSDYEEAIGEKTGAVMRVHTSNYVVVGFTEQPDLPELVGIARRHNLPLIDDIGSGALIDLGRYGIDGEPVAAECIRAGADVVLFSGDKLLGGPQCGIIAGKRSLIQKILKHPLMRALRVDKMTLAALAATLRLYGDPEVAQRRVPLLSLLSTPLVNLQGRAERLAPQVAATGAVAKAEPVADVSYLGGGSVPTQQIDTWCIALSPKDQSVDALAAALRGGSPSVVGRIKNDRLLLDLRSVFPRQESALLEAVQELAKRPAQEQPTLVPVTAAPPTPGDGEAR
ncbi:MAG TPA: L-seryl-tRNA(Sec) selenium transferase [Pirellulaceae bacterium]|nr:L-seryl-tRNA(Sec) selenium transferase [Pirellulaceae bacterium]